MKTKKESSIDAVAMVRKIRDENYKGCRGMSREEMIADIQKRAEQVNRKLNVSPKRKSAERELTHS